jgi:hypothetical protein
MAPVANLLLVSMALAANFATGIAGVVIPWHWYQRYRRQLATIINDTGGKHAQVVNNGNIIILLDGYIYLYVNSATQRC